jgi:hypothetical protein
MASSSDAVMSQYKRIVDTFKEYLTGVESGLEDSNTVVL